MVAALAKTVAANKKQKKMDDLRNCIAIVFILVAPLVSIL
jgi:hypothetical protein